MINLKSKLVENDLTTSEIVERITIEKTDFSDAKKICDLIAKAFSLSSYKESFEQLYTAKARLDESIKVVDKSNGDIYGSLVFCDLNVTNGTPIMLNNPTLGMYLSNFKGVNGHSFILDQRLRGLGIDKKMLFFNDKFLKENYDFIYCGVENSLKSHSYWKKLGFMEFDSNNEAKFYIMPLNNKLLQ